MARLGGAARDVKSPRGADKEAGRPRFVKDLPARAAPGKRHRCPPYPPHEQYLNLRLWAAVTAVTGVLFDNALFFGQRTLGMLFERRGERAGRSRCCSSIQKLTGSQETHIPHPGVAPWRSVPLH